jgi:general secretion pathway protein D
VKARSSVALALALVAALPGCAATAPIEAGRQLIAQGRVEEGLARLEQAAREHPADAQAHVAYLTARAAAVDTIVRYADGRRLAGRPDEAEAAYRRALRLDRASPTAQAGVDAVARDRLLAQRTLAATQALERGDAATAADLARAILAEDPNRREARPLLNALAQRAAPAPALQVDLRQRVTLELRDAPLRSAFAAIRRSTGLDFVFDRDLRQDLRTTIVARDMNVEDLLKLLLATNQLARKVLDARSLLIYPDTPAKQREYRELAVRSFYLANADARQTASMLRALVRTRDVFVDEKLNLVVIKDTPDAVRLAEQLVALQDLGEPEVVLDLEVLEVPTSVVQEFGIKYPDRIEFGVLGAPTRQEIDIGGNVTRVDAQPGVPPAFAPFPAGDWRAFVANPGWLLNLRKVDGSASVLAQPRIRVKNRDKAKVLVGEKVPVVTTTSTANVGVAASVNYLETGLKLDIEANVYLQDEVGIKLQLEVSNILEQVNAGGTIAYRLGSHNAATALRLKDGETQVLAGLVNSEDRKAAAKVPLLGDFPLLGRLFRSDSDQRGRTEIVLLVTPHVVRNLTPPATIATRFFAGAETAPGAPPLRIAPAPPQSLSLYGGGPATSAGRANARPVEPPAPRQQAAPPQPAGEAAIALIVAAPRQAVLGQVFDVTVRFPPGLSRGASGNVEFSYEPDVLRPLGADPKAGDSGRLAVKIETAGIAGIDPVPAVARFQVVARRPASTAVLLDVSAVDESGRSIDVKVPDSIELEIVR